MSQAAMIFPGRLRPECEKELGPEVVFYQASLEDAITIALELEDTGIQVIISRGGTAEAIRRAISIPVVNCEVTSIDLIDTLLEIKEENGGALREVALILYYNMSYDADKLGKLLGMKIRQLFWKEGTELERHILQAKRAGIDVVLGAQISVHLAEKHGIKGYLMQVGTETIRQAVQKAKEIIQIRHNDLAQSERLRSLIHFAHEGIVSVDNRGIIDLANPHAASILDKTPTEIIGQHAKNIFSGWATENPDELQIGQITAINNKHILYNRVPLMVEEQNIGGVVTFIDSAEVFQAEQKIRTLLNAKGLVAKYHLSDIVGQSPTIRQVIQKTKLYGGTDSTVLITGETGTGKELFAHSLHRLSKRRNKPFVAINCAALPENLLESELFGYEEGAFTGARKGGKAGLFELAHRGSIFLDEISEMPIRLQARLLRAIQEKEVMRLGGDKIIPVDARVIVATNRDLKEAVANNKFRSDLYFRLNILQLKIPPLRERPEDIPMLVDHFCNHFSKLFNRVVPPLKKQITNQLKTYGWPGNVRELENLIHKYAILVEKLGNESLMNNLFEEQKNDSYQGPLANSITIRIGPLTTMIDEIYAAVFQIAGKNKTRAAQLLGVNRMTVSKRI